MRRRRLARRRWLGLAAVLVLSGCAGPSAEQASERALGWFASRVHGADPGWANLFGYMHRRFGLEAVNADGEPLHEVPDDPERPELSRVYRRLVDPGAAVSKAEIAGLPTTIDRITASALHCDRIGLPADWIDILGRASELGGYALTHAALAAEWSRESGCVPEVELAPLQTRQIDLLAGLVARRAELAAEFSTAQDLWIEALAMLYYLQAASRVEPAWIDDLLRAQRPDGGFGARADAKASDPHATALALWVLLERTHPDAPPIRWVPPRERASEALHRHADRRFEVVVQRESAAAVAVRVAPRAAWKLAVDFPCALTLEGPGSGVQLKTDEAFRFDEEGLSWHTPLPEGAVSGRASFAVCQGDVCERVDHDFVLSRP